MERHGLVENTAAVRKVLIVTFLMNVAVAAAKLVWGYASGSIGMFSDGMHSLFDGATNVIGLVGIWIASNPPDMEHPYGHRKFETLFTAAIAGLIFLTSYEILGRVYRSVVEGRQAEAGTESFTVMGVTMAVNFVVMRYERRRGIELKSDFLVADALHTKSNLLASAGVVAGLLLTRLGVPAADPVAGAVVALFIAKIGYDILKGAADVLVDTVRIESDDLCRTVLDIEGVLGCHNLRTRGTSHHVYLDLHIQLDPDIPLRKAHEITHRVQAGIRERFPNVADIVIHTEPQKPRGPAKSD